ncbi:MAG: hypothetical protein M0010_10050 [Actinomycetota bacterium]|nr:hypothetical protein [Actinomycetota bacterium]
MTRGTATASPAPEIDGATAQPRGLRGGDGSRRTGAAVTALAPGLGAAAAYSAVAIFLYHRVLFAPTASMPGCNCGDQAQEVWFLRWPLYAVSHGLNPFFSTWMNYPKGINLAVNTSSPLLGLASAPLQLTIGTVATYDVLLVVAFAASALAMCLALRRWVRSWVAAFCGGLLFGFSPYMIGQGSGHLFLVAMFIPPIVLVLLDEIVVAQRHGAVRDGLLLGVLLVLEYYISPEVLAMTAVVAVCGVVLYAIANRHTVRDRATHVVVAACCCAVVGAAALAYPVWMSVHGPQHVVGPPHPLSVVSGFHGDLLGPVLPTSNQLLGFGLRAHGDELVGGVVDENGMYLGLPLAVVLVWFAWVYRRRGALAFFVAMAAIAGLLALGPRLVVDTRATGIPLPAAALEHLPFLEDILDVRFSLFLQLCAAVALGIGLDEMCAAAKRRRGAHRKTLHPLSTFGAPAAVAAVAIVALVPLIPASAYPARAATTPRFFTSSAIERIPPGTAVLTYPYVLPTEAEWNLTFQAAAGMRYRLFGADAFVPDGPGGTSVSTPAPLAPTVVEHLLADAYTPAFAKAQLETAPGTPTPPVDQRTVAALRTFLARYHVSTVLVEHFGLHPATVVRYVSNALGKPVESGGVSAWFEVPRLLSRGGLRGSRRTAHDGVHLER